MARTTLLGFLSILLVVAVIRQPDAAFQASLQGLSIWWNIVFPGLLPFLVLFEVITAFGLVHGFGVLLQPIMRRLFRLPGEAILPILFGWMSGYSAGADTTVALRRDGTLTKQQGQRLLALSHMPNPLFMLVVVGAGFLRRPELGIYIVAIVWLSALWTSLFMSLTQKQEVRGLRVRGIRENRNEISNENEIKNTNETKQQGLLNQAASALTSAREKDGRGFGKLLGDAVSTGVQKLMVVGGFMIFAAVIARLAQPIFMHVVPSIGIDLALPALLESHIGTYAAAVWQGPGISAAVNVAAVTAVLAWSGLSSILQTGYWITGTDLKLLPFVLARLLHALHAAVFAILLWKPAQAVLTLLPISKSGSHPAIQQQGDLSVLPAFPPSLTAIDLPSLWPYTIAGAVLLASTFALLLLLLLFKPPVRSRFTPISKK